MGQVIKVSTEAAVIVTPFHKDVFAIAQAGRKAAATMAQKMAALLVSKYGDPTIGKDAAGKETRSGGPSFEDYRADQKALAQLAKDKGLADNQWVRKPYAAAVKALYGAIPVAMTAEAVAKRAERDAKAAAAKAKAPAAPVGAPAGETQERQPSPQETAQQIVARIGVFEALEACAAILAEAAETKAQAVHIAKMATAARKACAEKKAA